METTKTTQVTDLKATVRKMYTDVQNRKAELDGAEKGTYITDGRFRFGENSPERDIRTIRDTNKIIEMGAFLIGKERDFINAAEALGLEKAEFTWFNVTTEQWMKDFKTRVTQLTLTKKKADLAVAEARLNTLLAKVDPDFVLELEAEDLKNLIG